MAANMLPIIALGAAALFLMKKKGGSGTNGANGNGGNGGNGNGSGGKIQGTLDEEGVEIPKDGWTPRHGTFVDPDGNKRFWQTEFISREAAEGKPGFQEMMAELEEAKDKFPDWMRFWGWGFVVESHPDEPDPLLIANGSCCIYKTEDELVQALLNGAIPSTLQAVHEDAFPMKGVKEVHNTNHPTPFQYEDMPSGWKSAEGLPAGHPGDHNPSGYKDVIIYDMKIIQLQLAALGFSPGTIDGKWASGGDTYDAVWAFQAAHGLQKDGKPGPNTRAKLQELSAAL